MTYVISGALTACGAIFYAARLNNAGAQTGIGLEILIITAAILGGNSLGGGRGSTTKALLGTIVVLIVINGVVSLGLKSGAGSLVLGFVLLLAVAIDMRWVKNRLKIFHKTYISPAYFAVAPCPSMAPGSGSPYAQNDRLSAARGIGVGESRVRKTLRFSTMITISIAAAGTAISFAFFHPITFTMSFLPTSAALWPDLP